MNETFFAHNPNPSFGVESFLRGLLFDHNL